MRLLIVDDDRTFRKNLSKAFARRGHEVFSAGGGREAIDFITKMRFEAAIVDMKMPDMDGLQVIRELKGIQPDIVSIVLTGYGSIPNAVDAIRLGAYDYITKPCGAFDIETVIKKVMIGWDGCYEGKITKGYCGIVGKSKAIRCIIGLIHAVKDSTLPVLITGESGTGKELVARALHFDSIRKDRPFIAVNCASLKPELLENELFGHAKGAFTGAANAKDGLLKVVNGGTLFIDEIADMAPAIQASLLRFIETGLFRPLGSIKEINVDVRIVAAINKVIEEEVRAKRFRHDLYYRLNVCRIDMPLLRERSEDIPLLVDHFFKTSPVSKGKGINITADAIEALKLYHWPGNIREMFNLLGRAILLSKDTTITRCHILPLFSYNSFKGLLPPPSSLNDIEQRHIRHTLKVCLGNISKTARTLGIDRRTLQRKMKRYGIK